MILFNEAHKKIIHPSRLPSLQRYFNKNVESWSAYLLWASGFVIPERDVSLIYGYVKTKRSIHLVIRPRPKSSSRFGMLSVRVDTSDGAHAILAVPEGWEARCVGGPPVATVSMLSRYVFVNYMMKNGVVGQLVRAAKDIFVPSRARTWDADCQPREGHEQEEKDTHGAQVGI